MSRISPGLLAAVALPPLVLAGVGLAHPSDLTVDSAPAWQNLHLALLPIFPLLALGPWLLVRGEHPALRWAVGVLGYVYAAFYTALDVLAGIGAGALREAGATDDLVSVMFARGNDLSTYGVWAFLVATLLAATAALRRTGLRALPGALLVTWAAWSFLGSHIYWPVGVLTMIGLAIGWTALVLLAPPLTRPAAAAGAPPASAPPASVPAGG